MIYFISSKSPTESKCVKIGTSTDPVKRLNELQTGNPYKLKLLGVLPGSFMTEKALHEAFSDYKLEGEWFKFKGRLKDSIMALSDTGRKHIEVKTVKQFIENGLHLHLRQKANRNPNFRSKVKKFRA